MQILFGSEDVVVVTIGVVVVGFGFTVVLQKKYVKGPFNFFQIVYKVLANSWDPMPSSEILIISSF